MKRIASLTAALLFAAGIAYAGDPHASHAAKASPDDLWKGLAAGNTRYVSGKITYSKLQEQRIEVAPHQNPHVSILSCADSRVPPELIFDKSVGDLFVVRGAGNIADSFGIASLEYAIVSGYTQMIVVLGHESCGAVKAAIAEGDPGTPALDGLVGEIRKGFDASVKRGSKDSSDVFHATMLNAKHAAAELTAKSEVIKKAVDEGRVKIVVAYYDLDSGKVELVKQ